MKRAKGVRIGRMLIIAAILMGIGFYVSEVMNSAASIFFFASAGIVIFIAIVFKLRAWIGLPQY